MGAVMEPKDWQRRAQDAVVRCDELVARVVEGPPSANTIALLDDISDTVCQVLDAAEFCRSVHADPVWRAASQAACVGLGSYVQGLNTHAGMYAAVRGALRTLGDRNPTDGGEVREAERVTRVTPAPRSSPFEAAMPAPTSLLPSPPTPADPCLAETLEVGRSLERDFQRYGVHLGQRGQHAMAALTARVQELGYALGSNLGNPRALGMLRLDAGLAGLPGALPAGLDLRAAPGGGVSVPADDGSLGLLLAHSHVGDVRRAAYVSQLSTPAASLPLLDELVAARRDVAGLMGHPSYAAYQLDRFSLAQSPAAVGAMLKGLRERLAPAAAREAAAGAGSGGLPPWDVAYMRARLRAGQAADAASAAALACTPRRLIRGLDALMQRVLGLRVSEEAVSADEGWAPGLVKLRVQESDGAPLGVVFLDLQPRPDKFSGAAHFVLRCGRGHGTHQPQTPVVALVASLPSDQLLSHGQLELLMHEWGHALHSLLSKTRYQHLSGTRGPLDLMEVPSHVFEHFARDSRGLALLLGRPEAELAPTVAGMLRQRRTGAALATLHQVQLSELDQELHGERPPVGPAQGTELARDIFFGRGSPLKAPPPGEFWPQLRFGHLVGYGANYYSYLVAQALSSRLWRRALGPEALGPGAGALLRERLLEPGGALPAREAVARLFDGDRGAVRSVNGGWVPEPGDLLAELGVE